MLRARVMPTAGARPSVSRRAVVTQASKGFGATKPKQFVPRKEGSAPVDPCPCGSGKAYKNCCGPYHKGEAVAATPEITLRARFSAFSKAEPDYIVNSTHPDFHVNQYQAAAPGGAMERLREDIAGGCNKFAYMGLKIMKNEEGADENEGLVSFEYLSRKRSAPGAPITEEEVKEASAWNRTVEMGRFLRAADGAWQYVDAQTATFDASMMSNLQQQADAASK